MLKQKAHSSDLLTFPSSLSASGSADAFTPIFDSGFSDAFSGSSNGFGQEYSRSLAANASSKASFNLKHLSLASINHSHNDVWYVLESIGKADHGMLLRAGNETYMRLCKENGGMKAALEAGRYVSFSFVKR